MGSCLDTDIDPREASLLIAFFPNFDNDETHNPPLCKYCVGPLTASYAT